MRASEPEVYEAGLGRMELSPYRPSRFPSTSSIRLPDRWSSKAITASSAYRTSWHRPLSRGRATFSNHSIQHVVQVDVREQRRDHATLGRSTSRAAQDALFEHPRLQPFVDHPPDDAVRDLLVEESSQVRVVDGVEVFRDIDIHHPAQPLFHEPVRRA